MLAVTPTPFPVEIVSAPANDSALWLAAIGVLGTLAATAITLFFSGRRENLRWKREQRAGIYLSLIEACESYHLAIWSVRRRMLDGQQREDVLRENLEIAQTIGVLASRVEVVGSTAMKMLAGQILGLTNTIHRDLEKNNPQDWMPDALERDTRLLRDRVKIELGTRDFAEPVRKIVARRVFLGMSRRAYAWFLIKDGARKLNEWQAKRRKDASTDGSD